VPELLSSILDQVRPTTVLDIAITALLIYWLFSVIRGTRAVRLVIGVSVLFVIYFAAQALELRLLTQILQTGAVVGLFALVVIFQPELRRTLERIGRVGSLGWLFSPESGEAERVAAAVARAASILSREGHGALIVLERETGLEEIAETGVMIHGDLSVDLLRTIFMPRTALHDGAVIIRGGSILAAGALLPLAETTIQDERFGTRHRAALGIAEQTDAVVVVISEENGQVSLVERSRIIRNLSESALTRALHLLLHPEESRSIFRFGGGRGRRSAVGATGATPGAAAKTGGPPADATPT
jgi:diadenylate cyclase